MLYSIILCPIKHFVYYILYILNMSTLVTKYISFSKNKREQRPPLFYPRFYFLTFIVLTNPVFFVNSFLYFFKYFLGALILAFLLIPLIAFFPTFFKETLLMVIVFSFLQPLKAFLAIAVTLYFLPLIVTVF